MGEIRIVGPGKTSGYPYPVCKKLRVECIGTQKEIISQTEFVLKCISQTD